MEIVNGSRWYGTEGKVFVVINTTNVDDHEWVYYRTEQPIDHLPKEFSCYKESFLSRFTRCPE